MEYDAFVGYEGSQIALICRVSELARRFGLRPSEIDPHTGYLSDRVDGDLVDLKCFLHFDNCTKTSEASAKFDQLMKALGCEPHQSKLQGDDMSSLEDAVEAAFSRAPQPRLR